MRYISVCSGIEAATVAWHHMGWTPAWFSEIEKFPSAVLAHHYPEVRNLGDMTQWERWPDEPVDLLVGGTPCQSFSVAGLRKGLDDPRGNLMLTFVEIAQRYRPRWVVWENVPGVLSLDGGRAFGTLLGALGELGYGWAYRVLDAQWFGVAQRRRRVFVVGCLGDQAGAAAVLFESESVQRNPAPSREKRKDTTGSTGDGLARCVTAGEMKRQDWETCNMVAQPVATFAKTHKPMSATDAEGWSPVDAAPTVTHWPRDRSDAGTDVAVVQPAMQVRRLTPTECERLQGFPDGWTAVPIVKQQPIKGQPAVVKAAADGPRYKALGNSMAVPCMRWIGERINAIEEKHT